MRLDSTEGTIENVRGLGAEYVGGERVPRYGKFRGWGQHHFVDIIFHKKGKNSPLKNNLLDILF